MRRGRLLMYLGFILAATVGAFAAIVLKGSAGLSPAIGIPISLLAAFTGFTIYGFLLTKMGF